MPHLWPQSPETAVRAPRPLHTFHTALQVNEYLQSRTYLVGSSATLADLVLYALVHPAAVREQAATARPLRAVAPLALQVCKACAWAHDART